MPHNGESWPQGKLAPTLVCTSFYHTSSPMVPAAAFTQVAEETTSLNAPTVAENHTSTPNGATTSPGKPKPAGGARITRPTQVVKTTSTVVTTSSVANTALVVEVKETVEVVKREAGPRIVKPSVLQDNETATSKAPLSHSKKIEKSTLNRVQKIKESLANEKKATQEATSTAVRKIKPIPG
jgi:hypothetical protein